MEQVTVSRSLSPLTTLAKDPNLTGETVAERLRSALQKRGMSQRELAAKLAGRDATNQQIENVRRQVVRWANDQILPDAENAARLAAALGTAAEEFVTPAEIRPLGVERAIREVEDRFVRVEERLAALERDLQAALERLQDDQHERTRRPNGS